MRVIIADPPFSVKQTSLGKIPLIFTAESAEGAERCFFTTESTENTEREKELIFTKCNRCTILTHSLSFSVVVKTSLSVLSDLSGEKKERTCPLRVRACA
jgi:hypothetical protein